MEHPTGNDHQLRLVTVAPTEPPTQYPSTLKIRTNRHWYSDESEFPWSSEDGTNEGPTTPSFWQYGPNPTHTLPSGKKQNKTKIYIPGKNFLFIIELRSLLLTENQFFERWRLTVTIPLQNRNVSDLEKEKEENFNSDFILMYYFFRRTLRVQDLFHICLRSPVCTPSHTLRGGICFRSNTYTKISRQRPGDLSLKPGKCQKI